MPLPTFSFRRVSTIFETTVATLRRKFDQVTDPAARALLSASGTIAVMMQLS